MVMNMLILYTDRLTHLC